MQCNTAMYTFILFRRLWWQFWRNFILLWWVHTPYLVWVGFVFNSLHFSERAGFGGYSSLRSKRFHTVSEQRKTEERDPRVFGHAGNDLPAYSRPFSRGLWLSLLVFCSETARKRLLRRLRVLFGYNDRGSQLYHFLKPSSVPLLIKVN